MLTTKQVAAILGIHPSQVRRLKDRLGGVLIAPRLLVYDPAAVARYKAERDAQPKRVGYPAGRKRIGNET